MQDGTWRTVREGTLFITITTIRGTQQQYGMQAWSGDGKHIHRIFVHQLRPHDAFQRLMSHYRPREADTSIVEPVAPINGAISP